MRCLRLKSESGNVNYSTNMPKPKSHVKLIAVIAVVAVAIVASALFVSAFISSPPPQGQDSWLFKGAYATYEGSMSSEDTNIEAPGMSISFDFAIDFTMRLKVVDLNSTHALVSTYFEMSSSFGDFDDTDGETVQNETSAWVPLSDINLMTEFEDVNLTNSYESTINIEDFGTRNCMIYEYELSDEGLAMTVYVDKTIGWPLKMSISSDENDLGLNLTIDINLTETNIPALQ
jgi:hypothetical protein